MPTETIVRQFLFHQPQRFTTTQTWLQKKYISFEVFLNNLCHSSSVADAYVNIRCFLFGIRLIRLTDIIVYKVRILNKDYLYGAYDLLRRGS